MGEGEARDVAARLHSSAIRLLRTLRREDDGSGLSAPRLSALSVIVFAGPMSLAELAAAEQVKPPTMSRIVDALVERGLVTRVAKPGDRRSVEIAATRGGHASCSTPAASGACAPWSRRLGRLADSERRALARGVEILERVAR